MYREETGIKCPMVYRAENQPIASVIRTLFLLRAQMGSI